MVCAVVVDDRGVFNSSKVVAIALGADEYTTGAPLKGTGQTVRLPGRQDVVA